MAGEMVIPQQSNTAVAVPVSRHTGRPLLTQESLVEEGLQRQLLMSYVQAHMVEGIDADYGIIPGTTKKTLLKPGAEKLVDLFRCYPEYKIEESSVVDYDRPLFAYTITCKIYSRETGGVVCVGMGSCSSHESKYRWKNADRTCPACGKSAIIKGKAEYGGGWLCFAKKGGCGAKFNAGDQTIESQSTGRVENPDVADFANTVLKIAKKRALVDAAIGLARCSDMFTQDIEDFQQGDAQPAPQAQKAKPVDTEELKRQLIRTGWSWSRAIAAMNDNDKTNYATTALPAAIDQAQLAGFLAWLSTQPDAQKPATTTTQSPAPSADNRTTDAEPVQATASSPETKTAPASAPSAAAAQEKAQHLMDLCHNLNMTWRAVKTQYQLPTEATPGNLSPERYEEITQALQAQIDAKQNKSAA